MGFHTPRQRGVCFFKPFLPVALFALRQSRSSLRKWPAPWRRKAADRLRAVRDGEWNGLTPVGNTSRLVAGTFPGNRLPWSVAHPKVSAAAQKPTGTSLHTIGQSALRSALNPADGSVRS